MPGAAQDLLIVEHDGREIMLPIIDAIIPTIDLAQQRIEVELIPGLLDDHQSNKNKDKNKKK
jgi:16S rRNA processing protein RimM